MRTYQPAVQQTNQSPLIMRKTCSCGRPMGPSGECAECQRKRLGVQAKLRVNRPGDRYEREADRVAAKVLSISSTPSLPLEVLKLSAHSLQRQTAEEDVEDEEFVQAKHQNTAVKQATAPSDIVPSSGGAPLSENIQAFFGDRLGHDFSQVRIHTDSEATCAANSLSARAFTVGNHIVFNTGEYNPESHNGMTLLAHELTHTLQQRSGTLGIQRAMKFEFQTENKVWRRRPKQRKLLGRKYGPTKKPKHSRFLHKGTRGKPSKDGKEGTAIELQSEAGGLVEFETSSWHRKWCAIKERIEEAVFMAHKINNSTDVRTVNGNRTVEFPFDVKHLKRTKDFGKGLRTGESLEVEIVDPKWSANIQVSESFGLSQFEDYLDEHLTPPDAEFPSSDVVAIGTMANAIVGIVNTRRIPKKDLVNLRNFVMIILEHLLSAKLQNVDDSYLAKEYITLMSRTNFSSIYQTLLSDDEKILFRDIVKSDEITASIWALYHKVHNMTPDSYIFPKGFKGRKPPGPKIREWLVSIHSKPRDLLSSLGGDNRALGRFDVEANTGIGSWLGFGYGKHTDLVKFEARDTLGHNRVRPYTEWVDFAEEVFRAAQRRRARTGSTELIYEPFKCLVNSISRIPKAIMNVVR